MKSLWYTVDQDGNFDIGRGDTEIAKVYSGRDDARLLAHAPELLDALKLVVDTFENGGWPSATIVIAKAAIAEAE